MKIQRNLQTSGLGATRLGDKASEEFGRRMAEALVITKNPKAEKLLESCGISISKKATVARDALKESFFEAYVTGTFKEDLTISNTAGAYTKLLSKTILTAAYSQMSEVMDSVIVFDDLKNANGGVGSLQIPIGQPTVAYEIAEGQVVNKFDEGVSEVVIIPKPIAAGTAITWLTQKRALPSILQWLMNNAANAIFRKLAADIVAGIVATAGTSVSGFDTDPYDKIIDARAAVNGAVDSQSIPYGFVATHVFLNYAAEATLKKSADYKAQVQYAIIAPNEPIAVDRQVEWFNRMKLMVSPFITQSGVRGYVLDSNYAVAYVPESDVETFEGQIPGRPYDKEVVLVMSVGQATLYPLAIAKLTA